MKYWKIGGVLMMSWACSKAPVVEKVSQVDVIGIHRGVMAVDLQCDLYNPNMLPVTLLNSDFQLFYNEEVLGKFKFGNDVKMPAKGRTSVTVEADIFLAKLHEQFAELVNNDSVMLDLKGDVDYKVFFMAGNTDVELDYFFNHQRTLKKLLDQKINDAQSTDLSNLSLADESSLLKPVLAYDLAVPNEFGIPFIVRDIDLHFRLNNSKRDFASCIRNDSVFIPIYDTTYVPLKFNINTSELSLGVLSGGLFDKEKKEEEDKSITVVGTLNVEIDGRKYAVPVHYERLVNLKSLKLF